MTEEFYLNQVDRLKIRFGAKAFDSEVVKVLAIEAASMSDEFFRRTVDTWIGTRKNTNPPLLTDFREAKCAYERGKLTREADGAHRTFSYGLKDALRHHYKVDTVEEAFELEKLKLRLGDKA